MISKGRLIEIVGIISFFVCLIFGNMLIGILVGLPIIGYGEHLNNTGLQQQTNYYLDKDGNKTNIK